MYYRHHAYTVKLSCIASYYITLYRCVLLNCDLSMLAKPSNFTYTNGRNWDLTMCPLGVQNADTKSSIIADVFMFMLRG